MTRCACLEIRHEGYGCRYKNVDGRFVRTVNCYIAATSDRFIIGSSERQMEALVTDCGLDKLAYSSVNTPLDIFARPLQMFTDSVMFTIL
jgi:hypothetical protein